eukprot:383036-Rhodomonas_salina.1
MELLLLPVFHVRPTLGSCSLPSAIQRWGIGSLTCGLVPQSHHGCNTRRNSPRPPAVNARRCAVRRHGVR